MGRAARLEGEIPAAELSRSLVHRLSGEGREAVISPCEITLVLHPRLNQFARQADQAALRTLLVPVWSTVRMRPEGDFQTKTPLKGCRTCHRLWVCDQRSRLVKQVKCSLGLCEDTDGAATADVSVARVSQSLQTIGDPLDGGVVTARDR